MPRLIKSLQSLVKKVIKHWQIEGLWKTFRVIVHVFYIRVFYTHGVEPFYDWCWGIQTRGITTSEQLGLTDPQCIRYQPVSYGDFKRVMKHVKVRAGEDVFVDYGSGKGRVLIMAARYPFRKVIGVELSAELNVIAQANLERTRKKLKCNNIEIITSDARQYSLPTDVTFIHMFNPFVGEVLVQVLQRVHDSLLAAPRKITLLYTHPVNFEPIAPQFPWIVKQGEVICYRVSKCAIYECMV